jgi:hypothetical protein
MKTKFRNPLILLLVAMFSVALVVSCSDDDKTPPADTTALKASITAATDLASSTEEGKNDGQYPIGSKTTLQSAITAAQTIADNTASTQTQVDNAKVSLDMAVTTYQGLIITPIAVENLVGHWSFNEGTGNTAGDESSNNFDGTLKTGPTAWGAGVPTWAADRTGTANKALHFNNGANVEIPYNTKLNPTQMSIALWINADEINAGNRFLGLQSWYGYKFQLQEANRPFYTVHTADDKYYDRDAEVNLPIKEWHHIAVTFTDGSILFYIDGTLVKTWTDAPGTAKSISGTPYNLVIGQDFPTDKYAATADNFDNDHIIPLDWGGYFRGYLDEIRIYNTALTGTQIGSLYDREKP